MSYFKIDLTVFINCILFYYAWVLVYGIVMFIRSLIKKPLDIDKIKAEGGELPFFLVLVPAHNERSVIQDIVSDLKSQTYQKARIRVLIIADNCSDDTKVLAQQKIGSNNSRMKVYNRRSNRIGKQAAINDALVRLNDFYPSYNLTHVVILDSDNRIKPRFFEKLAQVARKGYVGIQVNVKTKNPKTSILSRISYYESLIHYRLMQFAKDGILAPSFDGTGQCIRYDTLIKIKQQYNEGYFGTTKTEDFWLTIKLADLGIKIKYVHNICTWDEKPNNLRIEVSRRTRWILGYIANLRSFFISFLQEPSLLKFDLLMKITGMLTAYIFWILQILSVLILMNLVVIHPIAFFSSHLWIVSSIVITQAVYTVICWLEGDKEYIIWLIPVTIFISYIWTVCSLLALFKLFTDQNTWYHTPHTINSKTSTEFGQL